MKKNKLLRLATLLSAASFVGILAVYPHVPGLVAIHRNVYGSADSFGEKTWLLFFAALPLLTCILFYALPRIDPKRKSYALHQRAYGIIVLSITLLLIAFSWSTALVALGIALPVASIISAAVGLMLVICGNWMPQLRPNFFVGFRTPWAIMDPVVWRKTHRLGGVVFVVGGIGLMLSPFMPVGWNFYLPLGLLLAGSIFTVVYSFIVYKQQQNKKEDDTDA